MEGIKFYSRLCSLVVGFSQNGTKDTPWTPLFETSRELYKLLLCSVCGELVINPRIIASSQCKHTVCKKCVGTEMKQICSLCDLEEMHLEEYSVIQINIVNGYRHLCKYMRTCPFFRDTVNENLTIDKQNFIANVIEVADHDFEIVFTNSVFNGANFFSSHDEDTSQTSNSKLEKVHEALNNYSRKYYKRKSSAASPKYLKKQAIVKDCNPVGNESEFNQDSHSQSSISNDKECSNHSDEHSASPSGTHMITRGCKRSANLEIRGSSPELPKAKLLKSSGKSPLKKKDNTEKCTSRSECNSPEIVFNTLEIKQQSYCTCNTSHELAVSSPCYALNCPCYLNDRACGQSCMCKDCVNPNSTLSNPVVKSCKNKTGNIFDSLKSAEKADESNKNYNSMDINNCTNTTSGSSLNNIKSVEELRSSCCKYDDSFFNINASGSESIIQTSRGKAVVCASCSNAVINTSDCSSSSNTTGLNSEFKSSVQAVKFFLRNAPLKPPSVNCNESSDEFKRENICKFLYDYPGTGEKPGIIRTRSFGKKNFTQQPNAELMRRIDVVARKINHLALENPQLCAYLINQNQKAITASDDEENDSNPPVITIE